MYHGNMVYFKYIIVNTLYKGDNKDFNSKLMFSSQVGTIIIITIVLII